MNHRLVATSLLIVLASFFGLGEAKCKYRESRTGPEEIRPFRRCLPSNSQVGDEYWTTIGYDGEIKGGRSKADFMTFEGQSSNGWVGYWITRSRYPGGKHYESFGHVFEKPDGKLCGWFVGLESGEVVEVCGGFRILSRNRFNPNEENPFEWIPAANAIPRNSLGFHHHRIARYQPVDANAFYGDAKLQDKEFKGVSPDSERITEIHGGGQFEDDVWILKRRRDNAFPQEIRRPLPPTTTTQDPNHLWKYYDPHEHQGIVVDDRGGLRYPNQKITQLNYPPAQRYASADQDPRFNAYRKDSRLHVMPQRTGAAAQDPRYSANPYGNPQQAADPYADNSGSNYQIGQGGQPAAHKIGHGVRAESAAQVKASNPEETVSFIS
ncbi:hypothetical protein WR25_22832 isoform D [Diploscapter pachys]|uniref:Uncharacterized protein n=1 Tax=Diploscapter pachys TaxID=2018661 RepID=A0A2A2LGP4_9BILA|nr:hypothetical protein WR25_22832 isoform A [Diploscapter pachys]PAV85327.1 hypothetical protein WR25_22832 isoform B [Diploscapter pachys]PAV85328.1 hypothetical protein WR25_22832 isoform C [Diploscapter pachys]PAV85329.1 hypothetical protein WR25_22832 isoform D [Diploscapter pachys]